MLVSSRHLVSAQNVQKMNQFRQFHSRRKMFPAIRKMKCWRTIVEARSRTYIARGWCIERVQLQWAHQVVLLYQHSLLFAAFPFVLFGEKFKATSGPDWALSKRDNLVKEMHLMKRSASASKPMTPSPREHLHPLRRRRRLLCVCIRALCQLGHEKVLHASATWERETCTTQVLPRSAIDDAWHKEKIRESINQNKAARRQHQARPYFRFCPLAAEHSCSCISFTSTRCTFSF